MARVRWAIGQNYYPPDAWPADRPLISIVIPCYNHGHYLAEAVDSILAQTWQNLEIIVVNDGSTAEATRQALATFERPKTRILHHPENRGLPAARNTGIRQAKGKYICTLDADDRLPPTYLEKALALMEANAGISIVYSYVQVFGDESRVWYAPQFDAATLPYANQIVPAGVFRRQAWECVGGQREEMRLGYEDWEFWSRLARHGYRGYRIPEKLIQMRRVGRSFIHAAMERHDQLVADMRRYNPEIYGTNDWVEQVKRAYRDDYRRPPFQNMDDPQNYLLWQKPRLFFNWKPSSCLEQELPSFLCRLRAHEGERIVVSYTVLSEAVQDALYECTHYVYILPHFLPRYAWDPFVEGLRRRIQSPPRSIHDDFPPYPHPRCYLD